MKLKVLLLLFALSLSAQTYYVTTSADAGPGSLRKAILDVNATGGRIEFLIPKPAWPPFHQAEIHLSTPLPACTQNMYGKMDFINRHIEHYGVPVVLNGWNVTGPGIPFLNGAPYIPSGTFVSFKSTRYVVTNTNDQGEGSLRQALGFANQIGNKDTIVFDIPGIAPHKIAPLTKLPEITSPLTIEGTSQPSNGYAGANPKIELDGSLISGNSDGLSINTNNVDVYGLFVHDFTNGIHIYGNNHTIKGNVISKNSTVGILIGDEYMGGFYSGSPTNILIQNNLIGTTPDGTSALPNNTTGGFMGAAIIVRGVDISIKDNLISGNLGPAITNKKQTSHADYPGNPVDRLKITGNKIGTDLSGLYVIPNNAQHQSVIHFYKFTSNITIGGPLAADRNIISGNTSAAIDCGETQNFLIENNFIGTDVSGNASLPNQGGIRSTTIGNLHTPLVYAIGTIRNNIIANCYGTSSVNMSFDAINSGSRKIITRNKIYDNNGAIGNSPIAAPIIEHRSTDSIKGSATPNLKVELYYDNGYNNKAQGKDFIAEVTVDANGKWFYAGSLTNPCDVTAIAIDYANNHTSVFSGAGSYSLGPDQTLCNGTATLDAGPGYTSYLWSTGETTRTIAINSPGEYSVEVNNGCQYKDTTQISLVDPPVVNLGNDTVLCYGQNLTLNATNAGAVYTWNGNLYANTATRSVSKTGKYWVDVSFGNCKASDTINVTVLPKPVVSLGPDQLVCTGSNVILSTNTSDNYIWSSGTTTKTDTIRIPGKYWLTIYNACFSTTDTIEINHISFSVNLGKDTSICTGQSIILNAANPGSIYKWNNHTALTSQTRTVSNTGIYFVEVTKGQCKKYDTILVSVKPVPTVNLGNDTTICSGTVRTLDAKNTGAFYRWSTGETTQVVIAHGPGKYWIDVYYNQGCLRTDTISINFVDCNKVSGMVYNDINQNCSKDHGENALSSFLIKIVDDATNESYYATTNLSGFYEASLPYGNYHVQTITNLKYTQLCPAMAGHPVTVSGSSMNLNKNFGVRINTIHDVNIGFSNTSAQVRLGTNQRFKFNYSNTGTVVENGQVWFVKDAFLNVYSTGVPYQQRLGDTIIWNFTNLQPGETRTIELDLSVPFIESLSMKSLCNSAMINISSDINPWNNKSYQCITVGYPYDPNTKLVSPQGTESSGFISPEDSILTYTIHFQNTGSDTAYNVVIVDTLSSYLNIETVAFSSSSFPATYSIRDKNILTFSLIGINLPDSTTNEVKSHGFVQFTIHTKSGLAEGSILANKANIYFDLAAPIETPSAINTIKYELSDQTITFPVIPSKKYGNAKFSPQATSSSGLELTYVISGPVQLVNDSLEITGVGDVLIRAYQSGNELFNSTHIDRRFTIGKGDQQILFASIPDQTVGNTVLLAATGGASGEIVYFEVVSGPAIVSGNELTISGSGTIVVRALQNANSLFNAANPVERTFQVSVVNGISEMQLSSSVSLYPNPCNGMFHLEINADLKDLDMEILNDSGIMVYKEELKSAISTHILSLETGIYFLKLNSEKGSVIKKLIVE